MKMRLLTIGVAFVLIGGLLWPFIASANAQVGVYVPPEKLRFRVLDESVASLDGRSLATGWRVSVMRDTQTDQCVTFVANGTAMMILTAASACP